MSILVTPTPLNPTETFQVATPFSYSFTYSEPITAIDTPVYYFGENVFTGNSATIKCLSEQNETTGFGLIYTVSNMTPVTDVLECVLPILSNPVGGTFTLDIGSYVTFGGPTSLSIAGGPTAGHTATFGALGPFKYGLATSKVDSLKYTVLNGSPVSSFKITLARPNITSCSIMCSITTNAMNVTQVYDGQLNIGMIFEAQDGLTRAFTVTAFGSAYGGTGTYTVAPNDMGAALTITEAGLTSTIVAGSGDVVLSNSMTPAGGTAQFGIYTAFTYAPEVL
jgi:hypothetical protein